MLGKPALETVKAWRKSLEGISNGEAHVLGRGGMDAENRPRGAAFCRLFTDT